MVYPHQQNSIDYITKTFLEDKEIIALLLTGSIAHGFNTPESDIDLYMVVSQESYEKKQLKNQVIFWESASSFYNGGYFDGKYITMDYLSMVESRGNEPTRFALHDAIILFDHSGVIHKILKNIGKYPTDEIHERTLRFLSQFEAWKWYCDEAIKKADKYLLDVSVSKLILFGARLLLLDNHALFPYHKWLIRMLEEVPNKPQDVVPQIRKLLDEKTSENIAAFYTLIKEYRQWAEEEYSWPSFFQNDVEKNWIHNVEYIENI